jgi:hypothetical protein
MDIGLFVAGAGLFSLAVYVLFSSQRALNSEAARRGFGLSSWLTGQGMLADIGGSTSTSAAPLLDEVYEDGQPKMRETINISSIG